MVKSGKKIDTNYKEVLIDYTLSFLFFKKGRSIEDQNSRIICTSGYSKLIVRDISTNQSGKYTVEISNTHGTDIMATSLGVESQPEPPSSKPYACLGSDRISIAWCGSPFDGGCMINKYM